jgi:hypothetical protein
MNKIKNAAKMGSRCGSAVKWWNEKIKKNSKDPEFAPQTTFKKCPQNWPTLSTLRPSKIYPICDFNKEIYHLATLHITNSKDGMLLVYLYECM